MVVSQYDIVLVNLDPTVGAEIKKTRPCVVISPDEMNQAISTLIIAPMTSVNRAYPTRVSIEFEGRMGFVVLDQIRTIDKKRVIKILGACAEPVIINIKSVIKEALVD